MKSVETLKNYSHKLGVKGVAVLATDPVDDHFAECIREWLEKDIANVSFMEGERFRDYLYPWFEPATMPNSMSRLSAILNKTMVRDRIKSLGVELLIYVNGNTVSKEKYGMAGGYGAFVAIGGSSHETDIHISIWNLNDGDDLGELDVEFRGTSHYGLLGILPYYIPSRTEAASCRETADRISIWLIECGYAGTN